MAIPVDDVASKLSHELIHAVECVTTAGLPGRIAGLCQQLDIEHGTAALALVVHYFEKHRGMDRSKFQALLKLFDSSTGTAEGFSQYRGPMPSA